MFTFSYPRDFLSFLYFLNDRINLIAMDITEYNNQALKNMIEFSIMHKKEAYLLRKNVLSLFSYSKLV